jgi:CHASE2 domain-containing sensor protein
MSLDDRDLEALLAEFELDDDREPLLVRIAAAICLMGTFLMGLGLLIMGFMFVIVPMLFLAWALWP